MAHVNEGRKQVGREEALEHLWAWCMPCVPRLRLDGGECPGSTPTFGGGVELSSKEREGRLTLAGLPWGGAAAVGCPPTPIAAQLL